MAEPRSFAAHVRRDRRGRGLRAGLLHPGLPGHRSRAQAFDDLVLDAVEQLERRWAPELHGVEFAVEEVPPAEEDLVPGTTVDEDLDEPVPLARLVPERSAGRRVVPARIVVHRRPCEIRAHGKEELAELVFDVIVHEVARLLDTDPATIDPEGHG